LGSGQFPGLPPGVIREPPRREVERDRHHQDTESPAGGVDLSSNSASPAIKGGYPCSRPGVVAKRCRHLMMALLAAFPDTAEKAKSPEAAQVRDFSVI
jgi:hypothetical protein